MSDSGKDSERVISRRNVLQLGALSGIATIAGCNSSTSTDSGGTPNSEPGNTEMNDLIAQAREEETLYHYGGVDIPDMEEITMPAFRESFPWAETEFGVTNSEVPQKISSEYEANNVQASVVATTHAPMVPLINSGALTQWNENTMPFSLAPMMGYPEGFFDMENRHFASHITYPTPVLYNRDDIAEEELISSWEELADDEWEDRLVLENPSVLSTTGPIFAELHGIWGEEKWTEIMNGIADNNPDLVDSTGTATREVAQGGSPFTIGNAFDIGDNIGGKWLAPTFAYNLKLFVPANARNPAMGHLYATWATSPVGARAIADTGRPPAHPAYRDAYMGDFMPSDVSLTTVGSNTPSLYEEPESWVERFEEIFG